MWAMDFLLDQLFDGRRIRILTIVDAISRLSPAIDVRPHYRGTDVVETLERVTRVYGTPKTIRVDNGPEFISKALDLWAWLNGVTLDFSRPGKPTDKAFIESFRGSFRAECLNACWFLSLADARAKCEAWLSDYNTVRPHSSTGQKTPIELANLQASHAEPAANRPRLSRAKWSNVGGKSSPPYTNIPPVAIFPLPLPRSLGYGMVVATHAAPVRTEEIWKGNNGERCLPAVGSAFRDHPRCEFCDKDP